MINDDLDKLLKDNSYSLSPEGLLEPTLYSPVSEKYQTVIYTYFEDFCGQNVEVIFTIWKPLKVKDDGRNSFRYNSPRKKKKRTSSNFSLPDTLTLVYYAIEHCIELAEKSDPNRTSKRLRLHLERLSIGEGLVGRASYVGMMIKLGLIDQTFEYCKSQEVLRSSRLSIFDYM